MSITPQDLVQREVIYCVSQLVYEIAGKEPGCELMYPLPDYESAALDAGITKSKLNDGKWINTKSDEFCFDTAQEACEDAGIEPYEREIFEHWIISNWLADKLAEKGERVDKDFFGLVVWGRTTTGQAIYLDSVIEEIAAEMK